MFMIVARQMGANDEVVNTSVSAGGFEERTEAVTHLNTLIDQYKPNSGHEEEQDYWWIRENELVTRYVIRA